MADFVYNIALGRVAEKAAQGADLRLLVLKEAATDATLRDLATVGAVIGDASTTEADFTNYARAALTGVTVDVDNAGNAVSVDAADVTFTSAGGAVNNTTTDAIIYEHVTNDSDSIPLVQLDAVFTTDGNDVTLQMNADGFFGAS